MTYRHVNTDQLLCMQARQQLPHPQQLQVAVLAVVSTSSSHSQCVRAMTEAMDYCQIQSELFR